MSAPLPGDLPQVPDAALGPRVPIPWSRRWRGLRQRFLPLATFLGCLAAVFWLWEQQGQQPTGVGEVEAVRVDVAARIDGMLAQASGPPWRLLDTVQADAVLARLDDRPLEARLAALRAESVRLRKTLEAEEAKLELSEADRRLDRVREAARLAWQAERDRLSMLDRRALIETDRVVLQRREARVSLLAPLHERGALSNVEMSDERLLRDEIGKRISENQAALRRAQTAYRAASDRLGQFPAPVLAEVKRLLAPFEAAVGVQEALVHEAEVERDWLEVRAPMAGTIVAIHRQPGQAVRAGDPIVTIAADRARYIVGYVPQENRFRPEEGMTVGVRARAPGSQPLEGVVDRVGPQIELIPFHQRRNAQAMEWGQPVRILLPDGLQARPGELVDISFQ